MMNRMNILLRMSPAAVLALTVGCAGTPQVRDGAPNAAARASAQKAAPVAKRATNYPAVTLDAPLLYDLMLAEVAAARGELPTAVTSLSRVATTTRDPRVAERATVLALYAKDYEQALTSAKLWSGLQPDSLEAHEGLAEALLQTERLDEARAEYARILTLSENANIGQAYLKIATALGRHADRPAALALMQSLVDTHPQVREAHYALAHLTVRMGDLDRSLSSIERALALSPGWEEAALFKARVLVSKKDTQNAVGFFENYLKAYPQATTLRLNYARYLIDLKQWSKARAQFKRVASETPDDADALYAVGLLSLQVNQYDEAKKYLQLNLALQPENDQARLYMGQIFEQEKNYDEAARWYREIQGEAHQFEAQARIALLLGMRGDVKAARAYLRQIQPRSNQQRIQLALSEDQLLRDARQYDEALKVLSAALETLPDEPDLLYARALVAEKLNLIDIHESDLRKVIEKDPKNAHALNALGYTLADRTARYQEAFELIQQALALKPDDAFIMDSMGWVQYRLGNNAEAIKYLKRAFSIRNDAEISAHLGEVLWVTGDRAGAESVWREALKDTPDNETVLGIMKKFKQ